MPRSSRFFMLLNLALLVPLIVPFCGGTYVHDRVVQAHLVASSSSSSFDAATLPTLPKAFQSFGDFSFIQTYQEPIPSIAAAAAETKVANKPIPKKLKCSCEFQKVEAETNAIGLSAPTSFLEKVVNSNALLRSQK